MASHCSTYDTFFSCGPSVRQSKGNPGMFAALAWQEIGDCFLGPRMGRRTLPACSFVTMTPLFFFPSDASYYVRDMCPDSVQPRWIEAVLGVCCSGLQASKRNTWPRPLILKATFMLVPLGVNKSGKGEKSVSDLLYALVSCI